MSLATYLSNVGISSGAANILENVYGNVDPVEWCNGLDEVSRLIAFDEKPVQSKLPPTLEPWYSIYTDIASNGTRPNQDTFLDAVGKVQGQAQFALIDAVDSRKLYLLQWAKQITITTAKHKKTHEYAQVLKNLGYEFAYNICTQTIEVNGAPISDPLASEIRTKLRDANTWDVNVVEDVYLMLAHQAQYHPIRKYLNSLTWNGEDVIGQVASHFTSDGDVFPLWFKRWCVGAVARAMERTQSRVLVLDGGQGIGKDYFAKWLSSPVFEYFYEGGIDPEDKDTKLRLISTWIWLVNEFGHTTRRADREALKQLLTAEKVTVRRAYGKYDIHGTAMSAFLGTVNNEMGILHDPTGSRRFMVAHITNINWDYTALDVNQLWAQAVSLYQSGEPWFLNDAEKTLAAEINEQYGVVDIVEETIKKYFEIDPLQSTWWLSSMEIYDALKSATQGGLKVGSEVDPHKMASALTKLGLGKPIQRRLGSNRVRGYFGIKRII